MAGQLSGVEGAGDKHLPVAHVAAVLKPAQNSRYYSGLALISATGLRRGEALGLVWDTSIVNLDQGSLKVRRTLGGVNGRAGVVGAERGAVPPHSADLPCRCDNAAEA